MSNFTRALNPTILEAPGLQERLLGAVAEALGDAQDCTRVWTAWGHGTMGPDDFQPVAQDAERVDEIVKAVTNVLIENLPKIAHRIYTPQALEQYTADLVLRFASAAAEKLYKAQCKFGNTNEWMRTDWFDECRQYLREAVEKGDPLDVAIYSIFLWHHGEKTV